MRRSADKDEGNLRLTLLDAMFGKRRSAGRKQAALGITRCSVRSGVAQEGIKLL
jgi:hypothetical protein